jgi:RsiW-degrading membrane proteinase PrsW (M82 family)
VIHLLQAFLALLPVPLFLVCLVFMDSFKLVPMKSVLRGAAIGGAVAIAAYLVNTYLLHDSGLGARTVRTMTAPFLEEVLKAVWVLFVIRTKRVGFLVDAVILGFAVGTGFAMVENIYYLAALKHTPLLVWLVRGFGTAVMHPATTAVLAATAKVVLDRRPGAGWWAFLPGFTVAFGIHSLYNHLVFNPLLATGVLLIIVPLALVLTFELSEKSTRAWLGTSFDSDLEILELLDGDRVAESRIGRYLESLMERLPGKVVGDIVCYLRLHLELSIRAKGILLARQAGLPLAPDEEVKASLEELEYLERSIGRTGKLAVQPLLNMSSRDLWQLYMLGK